ncbi:GGDEF domain-containing protein [Marinifilum sp. JC120]|nr:GGDEF domain-containing protein [Marinifilum sp. JC120]
MVSNTDELSNVFNRRYFNKKLNHGFKRLQRISQPLSLIMIDIDYFKQFNDTYGNQTGDNCITTVAAVLKKQTIRGNINDEPKPNSSNFIILCFHTATGT